MVTQHLISLIVGWRVLSFLGLLTGATFFGWLGWVLGSRTALSEVRDILHDADEEYSEIVRGQEPPEATGGDLFVNGDDVRPCQADADRSSLVTLAYGEVRFIGDGAGVIGGGAHRPTSSTMRMARCGRSCAQTPHPLQVARSNSNQRGFSTTHCTGQ